MSGLLRWTGYPLVDVGAAGIAAFVNKHSVEDVTVKDAREVAEYVELHYPHEPFKSFLASVFPNSGYVNPSMGEDKRRAFMKEFLYAFERPIMEGVRPCTFCARPSAVRAFRQHIPLIMGEGLINFVPNGIAGLPVCGACVLSIQTMPLASVRSEGRLLLAHSEDPSLTIELARAFLDANRRYAALMSSQMETGQKGTGRRYPKTLLLDYLREASASRQSVAHEQRPASVSAYHLTNYGTGPDIAIYHLPSQVVDFLLTAWSSRYEQQWSALVRAAWASPASKDERRNELYDAMFDLPTQSASFMRRFLVRRAAVRSAASVETPKPMDLVSWDVTQLFLRKVVGMERQRIDTIRVVGDRIARYIERENDRALFRGLLGVHGYRYLRLRLVKASLQSVKVSGDPLISLDEFVTIFEQGEEIPRVDWSLARDLVLIRTIEGLGNWLRKETDVLGEALDEVEVAGEKADDAARSAEELVS